MPNPQSTARIAGHPIHPMLVPFPIAFFVGALATDIAFSQTNDAFFSRASLFLLGAGLVMAVLAALAGLTDFAGERRIRNLDAAWLHAGGNIILVLIEAYNFYIRYASASPALPPYALGLSVVAVLLLLFNGWQGWTMVYRHRVGIMDDKTGTENRAERKNSRSGSQPPQKEPYSPPRPQDRQEDQHYH